jgi:hypothetical protein
MKLEYFALGLVLMVVGVGGFYYMDIQLGAQVAGYEAGGGLLQSSEVTGMMEKVRLGLLVMALAGVATAGFGATGRRKSNYSKVQEDLREAEEVFCRHCGMPGSVSGRCAGCGQGRQISSSIFRHCVHCGKNASDDSVFCMNCGWKF